ASSMKVAGRKIWASMSTPCRPGLSAASASSTPRVTSSVLAHGSFSTIIMRPGPPLMTPSPIIGQVSHFTSATSPRRTVLPPRTSSGTLARSFASRTGRTYRRARRWLGVSMNPSVWSLARLEYGSVENSRASPTAFSTSLSGTPRARNFSGSTSTATSLIRSPQIGTLATPGTCISRNRIFQYAIIERSIMSCCLDVIPIFMTRLVADRGWSMIGAPAECGSVFVASSRRSCTICRAFRMSVPGLKMRRIAERPTTDFDRKMSRPGVPLSCSSSGTVINSSTSEAVMPMPSVWISTMGGANSGKTSTGIDRRRSTPKYIIPAATAITRNRNFKLDPTIQRIIAVGLPGSLFPSVLRAKQFSRAHGHHRGARCRTLQEHGAIAFDVVDVDRVSNEDERLGVRVDPRLALRVVENRGGGNHASRPLGHRGVDPFLGAGSDRRRPRGGLLARLDLLVTQRGRLDVEAFRRLRRQGHFAEIRPLDFLELGGFDLCWHLRLVRACRERQPDQHQDDRPPSMTALHGFLLIAFKGVGHRSRPLRRSRGWNTLDDGDSTTERSESQVERREHDQVEPGRCDEAAQDDESHRPHDLEAGDVAEEHHGQEGHPGGERRHDDRSHAFAGATLNQLGTERFALVVLDLLIAVDEQDAVARSDAEERQESHQRPERNSATGERRDHATDERHRQGQEDEEGETPVSKAGLQEEEDAERGSASEAEHALLGGLTFGVFAEQLGVVLQRELDVLQAQVDVARHGAQIAPPHVGDHVDTRRDAFVVNDGRGRHDAQLGHVAEAYGSALRGLEHELAQAGQIAAGFRHAPHHDFEHLLLFEESPDVQACEDRRHLSADIAGREAEALRRRQVDLDLHLGFLGLPLHLQIGDAVDRRQRLLHVLRRAIEHRPLRTEDAHDNGFVGTGQDFTHALGQVGSDVSREAGITVDHALDGGDRLLVVRVRIDRQPELAGVLSCDLSRWHGTPQLRADIADPRQRPQLAGGLIHDAVHRWV